MKTALGLGVSLALAVFWTGVSPAGPGVARLGVPPVQDRTGEVFREAYSMNFRRLLVAELKESGLQPFFINTGPGFDDSEGGLALELGREAGVDGLLTIRLAAVVDRSTWKRLEPGLQGGAGRQAAEAVLRRPSRREDIKRLVESGSAVLVAEAELAPVDRTEGGRVFYASGRIRTKSWKDLLELEREAFSLKRFKDTGGGRAAREAAQNIARLASQWLYDAGIRGTGEAPSASGECRLTFGVRYLRQERTSRNYTVAINGLEVSYAIRNGRVTVDVPGGELTVRVTVQDAPYGMPVQKSYDANDYISCSGEPKTAFLEIGPIGEAVLKWGGR